MKLEQKAARLKNVIEQGYGYTNKPLSEKRIKQMRLTLSEMETKINNYNGIFKKGEKVTVSVHAAGIVTNDGEPKTILRVDDDGVWLDNGAGNSPTGPYDKYSGVKDYGGFVGKQIIKRI